MLLNNEQRRLVEENMGLVHTVIKRHVSNVTQIGIFSYQDIFQIGCVGLSKAALKYKPGKAAFSTYACTAIRNEIYNALDYAAVRRSHEVITGDASIGMDTQAPDDFTAAISALDTILDAAKAGASGVVAKGIDAIRLLADGYTSREIGEQMGGASANNVTAWVSKARVFLRSDPDIQAYREAV